MQQTSSAPVVDTGTYTDLNRLSQLKTGDRDSEANVRKVAQEFESLFLNQMLKSMRAASDVLADKDSPSNSSAGRQYRDWHDQQLSVTLARQGKGIGLADFLAHQLGSRRGRASAPTGASGGAGVTSSASTRDDSKLLAMRRLTLPSRISMPATATAMASALSSSAQSVTYPVRSAAPPVRVVKLDRTSALSNSGSWSTALSSTKTLTPASNRDYSSPLTIPSDAEYTKSSVARFQSQEEFITTLLPMAEKAARQLGIDPHFLVAQAALETGWGRSMIRTANGGNSHNLFGIKSTAWRGDSTQVTTTEYVNGVPTKEVAGFRVYTSFEQSFNDYATLLQSNERYQNALQAAAQEEGGSEQFMQELQKAGYATDPSYARKVIQIARKVQQTYQDIAEAGATPPIRTRG